MIATGNKPAKPCGLTRGNFWSMDELNAKILDYITFYNQTAKPMKWKCIRMKHNSTY